MSLITNYGKKSEQLGTKFFTKVFAKKCFNQKTKFIDGKPYIVFLTPIQKHWKVDPGKLSDFSNKTAKWLFRRRKTDSATLGSYVSSLKDKSNIFKVRLVTPVEVNKCVKTLSNDCSTSYYNILVSFLKPVAEYLQSQMTFITNNFVVTSA